MVWQWWSRLCLTSRWVAWHNKLAWLKFAHVCTYSILFPFALLIFLLGEPEPRLCYILRCVIPAVPARPPITQCIMKIYDTLWYTHTHRFYCRHLSFAMIKTPHQAASTSDHKEWTRFRSLSGPRFWVLACLARRPWSLTCQGASPRKKWSTCNPFDLWKRGACNDVLCTDVYFFTQR